MITTEQCFIPDFICVLRRLKLYPNTLKAKAHFNGEKGRFNKL